MFVVVGPAATVWLVRVADFELDVALIVYLVPAGTTNAAVPVAVPIDAVVALMLMLWGVVLVTVTVAPETFVHVEWDLFQTVTTRYGSAMV